MWDKEDESYTPSEDGPEANLFRKDARDAEQAARRIANTIDILLASLSIADSRRFLFTFKTQKQWKLRRR